MGLKTLVYCLKWIDPNLVDDISSLYTLNSNSLVLNLPFLVDLQNGNLVGYAPIALFAFGLRSKTLVPHSCVVVRARNFYPFCTACDGQHLEMYILRLMTSVNYTPLLNIHNIIMVISKRIMTLTVLGMLVNQYRHSYVKSLEL